MNLNDSKKLLKWGIYPSLLPTLYWSILPYTIRKVFQMNRIDRFKGVSTKYLNNYLVWNNLVVYAKESYTEKRNIFLEFIMTTQLDEKCRDIPKRPPLPLLV